MLSLEIKQYVNRSTRIMKDSETIIDLILANNKIQVQINDKPKITEHSSLKLEFNADKLKDKYKEFARNCSKMNFSD